MNATFLLSLAAHRQQQRILSGALPASSPSVVSSRLNSTNDNTSETVVVAIPALIRQLEHRSCPLSPVESGWDGDASESLQPCSAASVSTLAEPPAAARPQCGASAAASAANPNHDAEEADSNSCLAKECRICLSADSSGDLVRPCSCCGTLGYTHLSCLAAWVEERGSLICELCGARYKQPYIQVLEPLVAAALQRHKERVRNASISIAAPMPAHHMSKGEWCTLLFSLFLLLMAFFIVSVTLSKRQG